METLLRKDTPYVLDKNLQAEFDGIKQILKSPLGLKPFNKNWRRVLYTDYSVKGVGFALTWENTEDETQKQLILCGSSSLSEKQKRLPAIYRENLAIIVALEKCRYWLHGCPTLTTNPSSQYIITSPLMKYQTKSPILWWALTNTTSPSSTSKDRIMSWQIISAIILYGARNKKTMAPGSQMTSGRKSQWRPKSALFIQSTNTRRDYMKTPSSTTCATKEPWTHSIHQWFKWSEANKLKHGF